MAIWQDLVDDHGFPGRYASVRRFVATLRDRPPVEARVVITTARGEEAQVDYGEGPMVRSQRTRVALAGNRQASTVPARPSPTSSTTKRRTGISTKVDACRLPSTANVE